MKTTMMHNLRAGLLALVVAGCGAEAVIGPLMILTNTWRDAANANHTFNLSDDTGFQAKRSGTFTGSERLPDNTTFQLEGYWSSDGKIQFTVHRSPDVTYRGTMSQDNADRIDFTSSAGALAIVRN